jgi:anti-sigma B factor antagonist
VSHPGDELDLCGIQSGDALRIVVAGDLDVATVPDLRAAVEQLAAHGMTVALDLDDLAFIDLAGVRELVRLKAAARAGGWTLELAGVRERVRQVADLCGLRDALVYP